MNSRTKILWLPLLALLLCALFQTSGQDRPGGGGSGGGGSSSSGSAAVAYVSATNLLAATFRPDFTNITVSGDSIGVGWGSQYLHGNDLTLTNAGWTHQVANAFSVTESNYAVAGASTGRNQWNYFAGGSPGVWNKLPPKSLFIYVCGFNDCTFAPYDTAAGAAQVELWTVALASFATQDMHPTGEDIIGRSGFGTKTGIWRTSMLSIDGVNTLYSLFGQGESVWSTNLGDTITATNIFGTSFILGYGACWTNGLGGSFSVSIDGVSNVTLSANTATPLYNDLLVSNVMIARVFTNLGNTTHTVKITKLDTNWTDLDYILCPSMRTATNSALVSEIYNALGQTSSNRIEKFNRYQLTNILTLNAVGLQVKLIPTWSMMATGSFLQTFTDGIHPNFNGHIAYAAQAMNIITGGPGFAQSWLASGNILDTYGARFSGYSTIVGTTKGVTNTAKIPGKLWIVATAATWTNKTANGVNTFTNSVLTGTYREPISPGAAAVSDGGVTSSLITFGD